MLILHPVAVDSIFDFDDDLEDLWEADTENGP
jgi:hypothetical protein